MFGDKGLGRSEYLLEHSFLVTVLASHIPAFVDRQRGVHSTQIESCLESVYSRLAGLASQRRCPPGGGGWLQWSIIKY